MKDMVQKTSKTKTIQMTTGISQLMKTKAMALKKTHPPKEEKTSQLLSLTTQLSKSKKMIKLLISLAVKS